MQNPDYQSLIDGSWSKKWRDEQVQNYLPPHRIDHTKDKFYCTCGKGPFKSMKLWSNHANTQAMKQNAINATILRVTAKARGTVVYEYEAARNKN